MTLVSTTSRFFFPDEPTAAEALLVVLEHAREAESFYRFYGLSVPAILQSGLVLEGDIADVAALVEAVPGTTRYDE